MNESDWSDLTEAATCFKCFIGKNIHIYTTVLLHNTVNSAFGLANDSTKPSGHGKSKKPGSPDFILIIVDHRDVTCTCSWWGRRAREDTEIVTCKCRPMQFIWVDRVGVASNYIPGPVMQHSGSRNS